MHAGPQALSREGPYEAQCSGGAGLKVLVLFEGGAQPFHPALGPENPMASSYASPTASCSLTCSGTLAAPAQVRLGHCSLLPPGKLPQSVSWAASLSHSGLGSHGSTREDFCDHHIPSVTLSPHPENFHLQSCVPA